MARTSRWGRMAGIAAAGTGVALGAYGTYAAVSWHRYGCTSRGDAASADALLDRFMPSYEVVERHHINVEAPAAITVAAAQEQDLFELPLIRAIFAARQIVLRAAPDRRSRPHHLMAAVQALGWGLLAEVPERELVFGAVTKPWEANVTFRAVPPEDFAAFCEPGFVKIVWTLRADPIDATSSIFRTETRALATDSTARNRFRRYWAIASPGITLIRLLSLQPLRYQAECRARMALASGGSHVELHARAASTAGAGVAPEPASQCSV